MKEKILPWLRYYWHLCLFFLKLRKRLDSRQLKWIESLEKNPEKQLKGSLGMIINNEGNYEACCLAEAFILKCEEEESNPFSEYGDITDYGNSAFLSEFTAEYYQLYSCTGDLVYKRDPRRLEVGIALAKINDVEGVTWLDIAHIMRKSGI